MAATQTGQTSATRNRYSDTQAEERTERAAQAAGGVLGKLVSWQMPTDYLITRARMAELLEECGLGEIATRLPRIREGRSISRALSRLVKNAREHTTSGGRQAVGRAIDQVEDRADRVVYQVTLRDRDRDAGRMGYEALYYVLYYANGVPDHLRYLQHGGDPVIFTDAEGHPVDDLTDHRLRALLETYQECYTPRDIKAHVILRALEQGDAIMWGQKTGVYHAFPWGFDQLAKLKALMAALSAEPGSEGPGCCQLRTYTGADWDEEARAELGLAALTDLLGELRAIRIDVDERAKAGEAAGSASLTAKKLAVDTLLQKAARMRQVASFELGELTAEAEAVRQRAMDLAQGAMVREAAAQAERAEKRRKAQATAEAEAELNAAMAAQDAAPKGKRRKGQITAEELGLAASTLDSQIAEAERREAEAAQDSAEGSQEAQEAQEAAPVAGKRRRKGGDL